jgi:hypothetical protein
MNRCTFFLKRVTAGVVMLLCGLATAKSQTCTDECFLYNWASKPGAKSYEFDDPICYIGAKVNNTTSLCPALTPEANPECGGSEHTIGWTRYDCGGLCCGLQGSEVTGGPACPTFSSSSGGLYIQCVAQGTGGTKGWTAGT